MQLKHAEWRLATSLATEKRRVVGEKPYTRRGFREPVAERLRDAHLWFERPPVASDIDEMGGFVLPCWRNDRQTCADDGARCASREFFRCQCRTAQKIDRKPQAEVAQASAMNLIRCVEHVTGDGTADKRNEQANRGGMTGKVEYVHISNGC
ncbi:hypothetical protein PTKU64_82310 [Paraburkholderia terrae]|uniref:Uncharacterized protein n=1 Tax=Paraburkholderia terrae TaxID=311230 RepID=A0ABN6JUT7_9BURK|nr:hypothetical protein PTKU64_82310 [Paraburkholderia terrae]BDC45807.1 hypothetical protein PTKU15_91040 [Paraburkholderia terrae]